MTNQHHFHILLREFNYKNCKSFLRSLLFFYKFNKMFNSLQFEVVKDVCFKDCVCMRTKNFFTFSKPTLTKYLLSRLSPQCYEKPIRSSHTSEKSGKIELT